MIDRKFRIKALNHVNGKSYTEEDAFLMCAKDAAVPAALEAYIERCKELGSNIEHIQSVQLMLGRVLDYQARVEKKVPDTIGYEIPGCLRGEM
jgi:hypothetical protein